MFQIIEPTEHESYREKIDLFMSELKAYNPSLFKNFKTLNKATLILAKENPNHIKGGAILFKKNALNLPPMIQEQFKDTAALSEQIWAGTIYLNFPEDIKGQVFESLCKTFYKHLYESLIKFGAKEKTSFFCLTLDPCEYLSTDLLGTWPYKVQVRHRESSDGLFHGILSLGKATLESKDLAA